MDVRNGKIKKLSDDILSEVAGGLETKLPLKTGLLTDDTLDDKEKKSEIKKDHEIE